MTAHLNLALSLAACGAVYSLPIRRNATVLNMKQFACTNNYYISFYTCHLLLSEARHR